MSSHLKRKHPQIYASSTSNPSSVGSSAAKTRKTDEAQMKLAYAWQQPYSYSSRKHEELTDSVVKCIVKDLHPYTIVEGSGFKDMLHNFDKRYVLPGRTHFATNLIPKLYEAKRSELLQSLKDASHVSLTTDGWTSRSTESYITTTVHWLSKEWCLTSAVLQTTQLPESHTSENLLNYTNEVIDNWHIARHNPSLPLAITTDNAANITKAVREGGYLNVRCFAHTVNLAAKKGLAVIDSTMGHIRRVVRYFNKSCAANVILKEKQLVTDTPVHKLILDCPTRWNSTHDMLERFREQYNAISSVLYSTSRLSQRDVADLRAHLAKVDCDTIENILEVLKPLKNATTCMCSENSVTISAVHLIKHSIMKKMAPYASDCILVKNLKLAIANDLAKRYSSDEEDEFLLLATAVDPRFKRLPHVSESRREDIFKQLKTSCLALHSSEAKDDAVAQPSTPSTAA